MNQQSRLFGLHHSPSRRCAGLHGAASASDIETRLVEGDSQLPWITREQTHWCFSLQVRTLHYFSMEEAIDRAIFRLRLQNLHTPARNTALIILMSSPRIACVCVRVCNLCSHFRIKIDFCCSAEWHGSCKSLFCAVILIHRCSLWSSSPSSGVHSFLWCRPNRILTCTDTLALPPSTVSPPQLTF